MKYIKLFEGFFDRDFGVRLWNETDDWRDWQTIVEYEQPEELTRNEIMEIIQTFRYDDKVNRNDPTLPWFINSYVVVPRFPIKDEENSCINITLIPDGTVIIYKFNDDRWMIELFDEGGGNFEDAKFFCDSYEGLINWIEDWREKIN
jgi:hypothetical protein